MKNNKQIVRVYEAAERGLNTTRDIAADLGLTVNRVSVWVSRLISMGSLRRTGIVHTNKRGRRLLSFALALEAEAAKKKGRGK